MVKQLEVFDVEKNEDYSLVKCYEVIDGRNTIVEVKLSKMRYDESKQKFVKDKEKELKMNSFIEEHANGDLNTFIGKTIDVYINTMDDGKLHYSLWENGSFIKFDKIKDTNLEDGMIYPDAIIGDVEVDFDKGITLGLQAKNLLRLEDDKPALLGKNIYFSTFDKNKKEWIVNGKLYQEFIMKFKKSTNIDISQFATENGTLDFERADEIIEFLKGQKVKFMGRQYNVGLSADMSINK